MRAEERREMRAEKGTEMRAKERGEQKEISSKMNGRSTNCVCVKYSAILSLGRCCCRARIVNHWRWVSGEPTGTCQAGLLEEERHGTSEPAHNC